MMGLDVIYLFCLMLYWILICGLLYFIDFGKLLSIVFKIIFPYFSSLLILTPIIPMVVNLILFHRHCIFYSFFPFIFSLYFTWDNFYWPKCILTDFFWGRGWARLLNNVLRESLFSDTAFSFLVFRFALLCTFHLSAEILHLSLRIAHICNQIILHVYYCNFKDFRSSFIIYRFSCWLVMSSLCGFYLFILHCALDIRG